MVQLRLFKLSRPYINSWNTGLFIRHGINTGIPGIFLKQENCRIFSHVIRIFQFRLCTLPSDRENTEKHCRPFIVSAYEVIYIFSVIDSNLS